MPLVLISCFYFLIGPVYFQGGDTAELVNASYHLFVPHPPGYPLYIWLQHFWLNIASFSTVFFRASILSIFFSFCTLCFLWIPLRKNILLLIIPFVMLGMNPDFVESTVLPDVFSLHGMFVAGILTAFYYDLRWKDFLIPFLFCLSFTNHHTTILLFPVLIYQLKDFKNASLIGLLCGTVSCILIYFSILYMDHSHPYSWGNIKDVSSIIDHFLRKDYGTFSLSAKGSNQGVKALVFLLQSIAPSILLIAFLFFRGGKKLFSDKKNLVTCVVLILSFVFTSMGNIVPEQVGEEVLKRFHVMPLVILASLTVYILQLIEFRRRDKIILSVFMLCTCIYQSYHLKDFLNLRNDSIIEDYSRNLFEGALKNGPALISANSDTAFFGIRYVSAFSGNILKQNIAVITPEMFFHPWFNDKVKLQLPDFNLSNTEKVYQQKRLNIVEDIIRPNLKMHNFLMTSTYKHGTWFQLVFLPLGRLLKEGNGTSFDKANEEDLKINYRPLEVPKGPQHFTKGFLFYQYTHIHMAQAYHFLVANDLIKAKTELKKAIQKVKFALPAKLNLCIDYPNQYDFCEKVELEKLASETKGFY